MYREIHTTAIADHALASDIGRLLALYEKLRGDGIPSADLPAMSCLDAYRDDLTQVEPTGDGDYVYTRYGRRVADLVGFDFVGRTTRQIGGDLGLFLCECYERAAADQTPLYTIHHSVFSVRVNLWERLVLPYRRDDGQTAFLVFAKPHTYNDDLLSSILEASPEGIMALRLLHDDEGRPADAAISAANRRAAQMLGFPFYGQMESRLSAIFPALKDAGIWDAALRLTGTRDSERFEISHHDGTSERWLRVTLTPLADAWMLSLSDVTDLKRAQMELAAKNAALEEQMQRLKAMETQMRLAANTDALTGLANRRAFRSLALADIQEARRAGESCSIVVFDIDYFKSINDAYGHAAGDAVLETVAWVLAVACSDHTQTMARTGGEEFALVLRGKALPEAVAITEVLRQRVRETEVTFEGFPIRTSASFGVAEIASGADLDDALRAADEALYRAKHQGRDCVVGARPEEQAPELVQLRRA